MDPIIGRLALNIGMVILILAFISILLIDKNSVEFTIALIALTISGTFLALILFEIKRERNHSIS